MSDAEAPMFDAGQTRFDDNPGHSREVGQVVRRARRTLLAANLAGFVLAAAQLVVYGGGPVGPSVAETAGLVAAIALYTLCAVAVVDLRGRRRVSRVTAWMPQRRSPSAAEQVAVLRVPWSTTLDVLIGWLIAVIIPLAVYTGLGYGATAVVRALVASLLSSLTASSLSFLLLEQATRPLTRLALAGNAPTEATTIGLRLRLLLAWMLTGAVPVVLLATAPTGPSARGHTAVSVASVVIACVSIAWGVAVTSAMARTLIEPVTRLRLAQHRVQDGDLSVHVPVEDAGEIGMLQAGFNHMVHGLAERQRLHDLFGRHVGIEVARAALADGVHMGGERCSASVLFIDLIGSTALAQRLEPEAMVVMLNDVFAAVVACASAEGGWVNKFEGDAALCVFGPPGDHAGHAAAALRTARALRRSLITLRQRHPDLDAGIGVSTGVVFAGNIGAADRYEYTVIGDAVNEAARLTEHAKAIPEGVLASSLTITADPAEARHWQFHRALQLRGRTAETLAYVPLTAHCAD
ncbi:adenylate/guanylate cyclase domain-containing protein [Nocardia terrae]|nr:adenylate/guanylate cyclase domain-containing protein [Nocardia terrae]